MIRARFDSYSNGFSSPFYATCFMWWAPGTKAHATYLHAMAHWERTPPNPVPFLAASCSPPPSLTPPGLTSHRRWLSAWWPVLVRQPCSAPCPYVARPNTCFYIRNPLPFNDPLPVGPQQEKNRSAQRRFRQRQKEKMSYLESRTEVLTVQVRG